MVRAEASRRPSCPHLGLGIPVRSRKSPPFRVSPALVVGLLLCAALHAGNLTTSGVSAGGGIARDLQLREFGLVFHPGADGYLGVNLNYFPLPGQSRLKTEYGKHEGYVLRQNFAGYFAEELGRSGLELGILWWVERHGWDSEDFLLFPHYGDFSLVRSVQTAGFSLSSPALDVGVAGGIQYTNPEFVSEVYLPESDSLFEWAAAVYGPLSLQASFHHADFRHARVNLNLESKQVLGGKSSGWRTHLPNVDAAVFDRGGERDSLRIFVEQNLVGQRLYAEVAVYFPDPAVRFVALKYYPDPSKVLSIDATCYRKPGGGLLWGGGLSMPFFRVAYNHADDVENLFGLRGTFVLQFHLGIEKIRDKFVGLNGSRATPMQTREIDTDEKVKKQRREEREKAFEESKGNQKKGASEITATGIVREDSK